MTDLSAEMRRTGRATLWLCLLVSSGLLLVAGANAHLIYVASLSQPACVDHVRQGERTGEPGRFSAAQSSCSASPYVRSTTHPNGSAP
jgi:hypothetical protein